MNLPYKSQITLHTSLFTVHSSICGILQLEPCEFYFCTRTFHRKKAHAGAHLRYIPTLVWWRGSDLCFLVGSALTVRFFVGSALGASVLPRTLLPLPTPSAHTSAYARYRPRSASSKGAVRNEPTQTPGCTRGITTCMYDHLGVSTAGPGRLGIHRASRDSAIYRLNVRSLGP